jgi:hypothetical protein
MTSKKLHPIILPNFRCRPCFVNGTPIALEIFPLAAEMPKALFQENENPNFLDINY